MANKIETALVSYLCPVCGQVADEAVLLNTELTEEAAKKVKDMHRKSVGWANRLCKDCSQYKDEAVFFIGVIPEKSKPNNPYRSGNLAVVKKDSEIIKEIKDHIITLEDDAQICFIEEAAGKALKLWNE